MSLEGELLGRYRLLRLLGSGGMGEVYLGEDARIGQQVAIKIIRNEGIAYPESESSKEAARLFEREAKAIARLDHPNILPLYAFGEGTLRGTPLTYLVMPYRKEGTLTNWLHQRKIAVLLTPTEVAPLVQQAAAALQHAHDNHVIHQDIKPTNFLVRSREGQPDQPDLLLADFGIAKLTSTTASASQSIRGTPTFMAPEQWEGHPVPATDQYALTIMVYDLLVGQPPFQGGPGQVMRQHYMTPPPVPSTLNPHLSPAIDAVLLHALSKQPEERFPSVAAFARAFQEAAQFNGELHAALTISLQETINGTTRQLTLPGGRQVSVTVPAGIKNGAILRLKELGIPYYSGGPTGPLLLTITTPAAGQSQPLQQSNAKFTQISSPPIENTQPPTSPVAASPTLKPNVPASLPRENVYTHTVFAANTPLPPTEIAPISKSLAFQSGAIRVQKPMKPGITRRVAMLGLAGLVIIALASGIVWFTVNHAAPNAAPNVSITEFPLPPSISSPTKITVGPDRNLWFIETNSNQVGRITTSGSVTEFPLPAPAYGITAGPDGNLWFTNGVNQIERMTTAGKVTGEFATPTANSSPQGITTGPDGNLWFIEYTSNKIGRITPGGSVTEFPLPPFNSNPNEITTGPDGNLWFTESNSNQIGRITPSGTITEFPLPTSNDTLYGITAGHDGNLWFTDVGNNQIGRITPGGTITEFPVPTLSSNLQEITAGHDGNLWFTEPDSNQIGRITPGGTITEYSVPTPNSGPSGITTGPDGNLWFTESAGNKIGRITISK